MRVNVTIDIQRAPQEVAKSRVLRYGHFNVTCNECRDVLLMGKYLDHETDEQIWKVIRAHAEEHYNREHV